MSGITEYTKLMRLKAIGVSNIAVFGALCVNGSLESTHFVTLFSIGTLFNTFGFVFKRCFLILQSAIRKDYKMINYVFLSLRSLKLGAFRE